MQQRVCPSWFKQHLDYLNTAKALKVEIEDKLGVRTTTLWMTVDWVTQTSRKAGPANVSCFLNDALCHLVPNVAICLYT